jgi:mRNA interferase RelE/StbE
MPFRVALRPKTEKAIAGLDKPLRDRVWTGIEHLRADPLRPRPGADIKMLRGQQNQYRLRIGDYRLLYVVADDIVYITDLRHRSHAYD